MDFREIGTFEQVFFRNLVSLVFAAAVVVRNRVPVWDEMKCCPLPMLGRSFFGFLGILLFFYAVANAPQTDVAMLNRSSPGLCDAVRMSVFERAPYSCKNRLRGYVPDWRIYRHESNLWWKVHSSTGRRLNGSCLQRYRLHLSLLLHPKSGVSYDYPAFFSVQHRCRRATHDPEFYHSKSKNVDNASFYRHLCSLRSVFPHLRLSSSACVGG